MGFLKTLGEFAGELAGGLIGGAIHVVGDTVNSEFIREVGDGVDKATSNTGKIIGSVAEGTFNCISGLATSDDEKASKGFEEVLDTGEKTIRGIGRGIQNVTVKSIDTIEAIANGDTEKAVKVGKELAKTVCVGAFAIGVCEIVDGVIDGDFDVNDMDGHDVASVSFDAQDMDGHELVENDGVHHVQPFERHLSDGSVIWVDGDGNTGVDTYDGWVQSNPDYRV